jgi:hypothetical protein
LTRILTTLAAPTCRAKAQRRREWNEGGKHTKDTKSLPHLPRQNGTMAETGPVRNVTILGLTLSSRLWSACFQWLPFLGFKMRADLALDVRGEAGNALIGVPSGNSETVL